MSGYGSGMPPLDDDYDDFDPRTDPGAMRRPGMMDPPPRPGGGRPMPLDEPMNDPGIGGIRGDVPFGDDLFHEIAREHAGEPPSPLGHQEIGRGIGSPMDFGYGEEREGFDIVRGELEGNEYLGQRPGANPYGRFDGIFTDNDLEPTERPPLLSEGFPMGSAPTAATTMPQTYHGSAIGRRFSGRNDSMPPGAAQYVGRDEPQNWGDGIDGPSMYPSEMVDDHFLASRDADPDWSPPSIPLNDAERLSRLTYHDRDPDQPWP